MVVSFLLVLRPVQSLHFSSHSIPHQSLMLQVERFHPCPTDSRQEQDHNVKLHQQNGILAVCWSCNHSSQVWCFLIVGLQFPPLTSLTPLLTSLAFRSSLLTTYLMTRRKVKGGMVFLMPFDSHPVQPLITDRETAREAQKEGKGTGIQVLPYQPIPFTAHILGSSVPWLSLHLQPADYEASVGREIASQRQTLHFPSPYHFRIFEK